MATDDDMRERVARVETVVTNLDQKWTSLEEKVTTLDQRMTTLDQKVTKLDERVTNFERKFDDHATEKKIQFEQVREDIRKLGEGYKSGLKAISRQIKNLDRRWSEKWSTHDLALTDHGKRIIALEQRRR